MRKNLEKFGKTLGVLASATEFLVKFLLYSFTLQSGVKFRPKSFFTAENPVSAEVFADLSITAKQTICPLGLGEFVHSKEL